MYQIQFQGEVSWQTIPTSWISTLAMRIFSHKWYLPLHRLNFATCTRWILNEKERSDLCLWCVCVWCGCGCVHRKEDRESERDGILYTWCCKNVPRKCVRDMNWEWKIPLAASHGLLFRGHQRQEGRLDKGNRIAARMSPNASRRRALSHYS